MTVVCEVKPNGAKYCYGQPFLLIDYDPTDDPDGDREPNLPDLPDSPTDD